MVIMTAGTFLSFNSYRCMIAFLLIDSFLNFSMTGKAFAIGNFCTQGMALGTFAHTFQMCMYLDQLTGRNLGKHRVDTSHSKQKEVKLEYV